MSRRQAEDLVVAFYRKLLLRDPDPEGFSHYSTALHTGAMTVEDVLDATLHSYEHFWQRGRLMAHYHPDEPDGFFAELSQYGEVSVLLREMLRCATTNRLVVDVGVRGRDDSNSYDLLRWFGWSGLLIEANAEIIAQIEHEFGSLDYKVVNVAVSDFVGTAQFHVGHTDGVSSLNEDSTRQFGPIAKTVTVQVERLPNILEREGIPLRFGLLSIDIEGEDIKVLNDLMRHSAYRPDWIIFETAIEGDYYPGLLPLDPQFDACYFFAGKTAHNLVFRHRSLRIADPL